MAPPTLPHPEVPGSIPGSARVPAGPPVSPRPPSPGQRHYVGALRGTHCGDGVRTRRIGAGSGAGPPGAAPPRRAPAAPPRGDAQTRPARPDCPVEQYPAPGIPQDHPGTPGRPGGPSGPLPDTPAPPSSRPAAMLPGTLKLGLSPPPLEPRAGWSQRGRSMRFPRGA
ncbi:uncharacterized protein [Aphelocoma coerulescens]|uniref:uncharacterized protein n=1 Tax=Aphelocoma coerulescens TaxID=39617 RepID=UPI00360461DB